MSSVINQGKQRKRMIQRFGFNFFDVFVVLFCVAFALMCFYPIWYVLLASITPYEEYIKGGALMLPRTTPDFQYYQAILSTKSFLTSMWISASKTILATALTMIVTPSLSYATSKSQVRGMKALNALVVFNLFFAGGLIPEYINYQRLGMIRTYWVMVIPSALNIIYYIVMRNYFSFSVPTELEEAAKIDGCNDISVFYRIILPLSKPMLAAVGLFIAVINWNDYYNYMMFISNKPDLQPFAWVLRRMLVDPAMMNQVRTGAAGIGLELPPPMALRMATIICAMLPIMLVYPFLQRHFAKGILIGAVKE